MIHGLLLDASYWHINGIDVTGKSLRVQGSHNLIERVTAYRNDDTGIQISSPEKIGRPLWASYNRVVDSESYANEDPGKINADGFAVKMRVGKVTGWSVAIPMTISTTVLTCSTRLKMAQTAWS